MAEGVPVGLQISVTVNKHYIYFALFLEKQFAGKPQQDGVHQMGLEEMSL